jgi:hypothetical protein
LSALDLAALLFPVFLSALAVGVGWTKLRQIRKRKRVAGVPQYDVPAADTSTRPATERGRVSAERDPALAAAINQLVGRSGQRAAAPTMVDKAAPDLPPLPAAPFPAPAPPVPSSPAREPAAAFDDVWSQPALGRTVDAPRRPRGGAPIPFDDAVAAAAYTDGYSPARARNTGVPPATLLKSGVVDGMAYSLYSDGSIEAQMAEEMMRFASIDELRAHLDQRPLVPPPRPAAV